MRSILDHVILHVLGVEVLQDVIQLLVTALAVEWVQVSPVLYQLPLGTQTRGVQILVNWEALLEGFVKPKDLALAYCKARIPGVVFAEVGEHEVGVSVFELAAWLFVKSVAAIKDAGELVRSAHEHPKMFIYRPEVVGVLGLVGRWLCLGRLGSSAFLELDSMLQELEGLVRGEGLLVLGLANGFGALGVKELCVIDIRVLPLELSDLLVESLLLLRSALDHASNVVALALVDGVPCNGPELLELFQTRL